MMRENTRRYGSTEGVHKALSYDTGIARAQEWPVHTDISTQDGESVEADGSSGPVFEDSPSVLGERVAGWGTGVRKQLVLRKR